MGMVQRGALRPSCVAIFSMCRVQHGAISGPDAPKPAFEVASVKPNNTASRGSSWSTQPGGRFTATNLTLAMIIRNAFDLQESQLVGRARLGIIGAV